MLIHLVFRTRAPMSMSRHTSSFHAKHTAHFHAIGCDVRMAGGFGAPIVEIASENRSMNLVDAVRVLIGIDFCLQLPEKAWSIGVGIIWGG